MEVLKVMKALADDTRLRVFTILGETELNVNEIVRVMGMGQSRISRHLGILTDSGLLESRRDGSWVFYRASRQADAALLRDFILSTFGPEETARNDAERVRRLIDERSRREREFFDSMAAGLHDLKREIFDEIDQAGSVLAVLGRNGRPHTGTGPLCDIGCGTGDLYAATLKTGNPWVTPEAAPVRPFDNAAVRYVGVDNSPNMLAEARRRFRDHPGIEFRLGEIEHLPLGNGEAEAGVMNMVLHHLQSPYDGIREAFRILAPGGRFVLAEFEKHERESMRTEFGDRWLGFDPQEIAEWLQRAGFVTKQNERIELSHGLAMIIYAAEKPPAGK